MREIIYDGDTPMTRCECCCELKPVDEMTECCGDPWCEKCYGEEEKTETNLHPIFRGIIQAHFGRVL